MSFRILDTHTTGPWKVGDRNLNDNTLAIMGCDGIRESKCSRIASVEPRPFYTDDQEANAHLLAAAPDLLAACEETATAIHTYQERGSHKDREDLNRCWQTIRLAIAKATHYTGD